MLSPQLPFVQIPKVQPSPSVMQLWSKPSTQFGEAHVLLAAHEPLSQLSLEQSPFVEQEAPAAPWAHAQPYTSVQVLPLQYWSLLQPVQEPPPPLQ